MTVVSKATANRVGPIGARSDCHRHARTPYVSAVTMTAYSSNQRVGPARFGPHFGQIGLAEEERKQPEGEQENEGRASSWPHASQTVVPTRALHASSWLELTRTMPGEDSMNLRRSLTARIRIRGVFGGNRLSAPGSDGQPPRTLLQDSRSKYMGKRELLLIVAFMIAGSNRLPGHRAASRAGRARLFARPTDREHSPGDPGQSRIGRTHDDEHARRGPGRHRTARWRSHPAN